MEGNMYAIAIIPININRDEQVRFYRADDWRNNDTIDLFDTAQDAQDAIDEIYETDYCTGQNEIGRPDYYIIDEDDADFIRSGRDGDLSRYDWDDSTCHRNNGNACGECDECVDYIIAADRQYIVSNSVSA
jgi:hypothetical protein